MIKTPYLAPDCKCTEHLLSGVLASSITDSATIPGLTDGGIDPDDLWS